MTEMFKEAGIGSSAFAAFKTMAGGALPPAI